MLDDEGLDITKRGIRYWKEKDGEHTAIDLVVNSSLGLIYTNIQGLDEYTLYYYQAYVIISEATWFGDIMSFRTGGSITDVDGNTYYSILLGNQEWLAQNLKVTKYRNGDLIHTGHNDNDWRKITEGSYSIYPTEVKDALGGEKEKNMKDIYGLLYNYYAIVDQRGLCPLGWRVPRHSEWETLRDFIGVNNTGGKLKSTRVTPDDHPRWSYPNVQATDQVGFGGHPAGLRANHGIYDDLGRKAYWWTRTSSIESVSSAHFVRINQENGFLIFGIQNKNNGFSVRCIKD